MTWNYSKKKSPEFEGKKTNVLEQMNLEEDGPGWIYGYWFCSVQLQVTPTLMRGGSDKSKTATRSTERGSCHALLMRARTLNLCQSEYIFWSTQECGFTHNMLWKRKAWISILVEASLSWLLLVWRWSSWSTSITILGSVSVQQHNSLLKD